MRFHKEVRCPERSLPCSLRRRLFGEKALFRMEPRLGSESFKAISEHKVFRMLVSKGKKHPGSYHLAVFLVPDYPIDSYIS
jgi:hypothetical protein